MSNKEESNYQIDNNNSVLGQVIGESNQVVQNFYGYDRQQSLTDDPSLHQFTLSELERIREGQTFKGEVYTRLSLLFLICSLACVFWVVNKFGSISLITLALGIILCVAFREASRLQKDAFIRLSTDKTFESQIDLREEIRIMKENNEHAIWK
ncbi:MAG TPA: hypothetical protein VGL94_02430 [Ktedonobacteraceae bacterium]|jgi:hypothetical protein